MILAGITIVTLTGDNELLKKAGDSKELTFDAEIGEKIRLAYAEWIIKQYEPINQSAEAFMYEKLGETIPNLQSVEEGPTKTFTVVLTDGKNYAYNATTNTVDLVVIKDNYPESAEWRSVVG